MVEILRNVTVLIKYGVSTWTIKVFLKLRLVMHGSSLEVEVRSQLLAGSTDVDQKDRISPFTAKSEVFRHPLKPYRQLIRFSDKFPFWIVNN